MLAWLMLRIRCDPADGLNRLAQDYTSRRLEDDLNLELNSMILTHAGDLDVSFFENPASQDVLFRAKQNAAGNLSRFVGGTSGVVSNLIQIVSLLAIVVAIEPLILIVIVSPPSPTCVSNGTSLEIDTSSSVPAPPSADGRNTLCPRLPIARSVPEAKILNLAPMMIRNFAH